MTWWLWLLVGLALLGIEMLTPGGFFTIFFGVAAIIVGVLTRFGLAGPAWMQWIWFSGLSIASLLFLRKPLLDWMRRREVKRPAVDTLVGETAVVLEPVPGNGVGKAELRGTSWSARSADGSSLPAGTRCRVDRVDGLTLWIKAD
jgi:membrane protein implicated in regulation of membrane protease activity